MHYTYAYHAFGFGKYMYRLHSVHREWEEDVRKTFSNAVIDDLRDEGSTLPFMSIARDKNGCLVGSFYHHTIEKRGFTKTHSDTD